MPRLIAPTTTLHAEWLEAHEEWGPGLHEDGFGLEPTDEVKSAEGFARWVDRVNANSENATSRWIMEGDRVQGAIALRHHHNDRTGHIGYGIRPSARGQGLATWALGQILNEARARHMDRVLLICTTNNHASAKTIEANGGILESTTDPNSPVRRYWIHLNP
jgi:predicted acetyltransferase